MADRPQDRSEVDATPSEAGAADGTSTVSQDALPWLGSLRALQQAAAVITQARGLEELFDAIADQVQLVVPYHSLRLFLVEDDGEHLRPAAIRSIVDDAEIGDLDDPRLRLRIGTGVTGTIAETGNSEIVYDLENHPLAYHIPDTPRVEESMVGVPLIHARETIGVLTLTRPGLAQFTPEQTAMLEVLAVTITATLLHRRALLLEQRARSEQDRLHELHSTFVANVSHELRTPLTTIQGFVELAERHADEDLAPLLAGARRGAKRLAGLVDDLLEIVALEAGKSRIAPEPHHLGELVELAFERAGETRPHVELDNIDRDRVLIVDATRVANVLAELLMNALKYGPDDAPIVVRYSTDDRFHHLDVSDQGSGIPEEQREAIFERFTQGDPTSTRQRGGTGIGLALARGIARWHGGDLLIVTDAPTTTFRLTLPHTPAPRDEV